jgi:hypothetical protein
MGDVHSLPFDSGDMLRRVTAAVEKYLETVKPDSTLAEKTAEQALYDSTVLTLISRGVPHEEAASAARRVVEERRKL